MNAPFLAGLPELSTLPAKAANSAASRPCADLFDSSPVQAKAEAAVLFRQGGMSREVFLLDHGLVKLTYLTPGGEPLISQLCSLPGSLIGDACAILGRHQVTAAVVTRNTRLRAVSTIRFIERLRNNPELSWQVHQSHCQRHAELLDRSAQIGDLTVRQRLEQLLWNLGNACELLPTLKGLRMALPLKYRELAQLIAVSPEHLCRTLGALERDGLILRDKGWLYLVEREALFHRPNPWGERRLRAVG